MTILTWSLVLSFVLLPAALAQEPPELRFPRTGGGESPRVVNVANDPISSYSNRREAALAALQAGYRAATAERNRGRAIRFLLVSLHRDPFVAKALYDMGVLCAQEERWRDALDFYRTALKANPDPVLAQLSTAEIERVQAIERMESTPEGRKRRAFDSLLLQVVKKNDNPFSALTDLRDLVARDNSRWETQAFAGVMHAKTGDFPAVVKDLEEAARLAPPTRRPSLQSAAEVARREANFKEQVNSADGLWEKRQYDSAAKMYAKAWEDSPGHLDIEMEAATGFLLADQVPLAVDALVQLHNSRSDELSAKAAAMLKELGSISEVAQGEAARERTVPAGEQSGEAADRIARLVGQVTTPQMELAAKPNPSLIPDNTFILPVPDEDLTAGHNDSSLLSTQSVFALYQRDLPAVTAPPPVAAPAADAPPASPGAAAPVDRVAFPHTLPPPGPLSVPSPAEARAAESGTSAAEGRLVAVNSDPAGATVVFDKSPSLSCTTPCRLPLAPGRHTLLATLAGYRDALRIPTVDKNAAPVEVTLEAKRGSLTVVSQIPGAAVFLNGKMTDKQTPASFTLGEGDYEVGVQVDGEMVVKKVSIKDSALVRVPF
jgi:tetratricopeptide (TPR) repeat protein